MFFSEITPDTLPCTVSCLSEYVREDRKDMRILPETDGERRAATARCDCGGKQAVPGFPAVNRIQGHGSP